MVFFSKWFKGVLIGEKGMAHKQDEWHVNIHHIKKVTA